MTLSFFDISLDCCYISCGCIVLNCMMCSTSIWIILIILGVFNIRKDKKTPPTKAVAKKVGMIAGGTGNEHVT